MPATARRSGETPPSKEFVRSVERAFSIVRAFGRESPSLTLSQVAERTGLTRASARRFLMTLQSLGYIGSEDRQFFLRPRILDLGFAYLSSVPVFDIVEAHMEALVQQVQESSSASVLDGTDVIYILRVPTKRIMSVQIEVGTRLPAYATSMGRVLLAALGPEQLDNYFRQVKIEQLTPMTVTNQQGLRLALDASPRTGVVPARPGARGGRAQCGSTAPRLGRPRVRRHEHLDKRHSGTV